MPPNVSEDWHLKRVVVGRDYIHFPFLEKKKCVMTRMGFVFWSAVRRRRSECDSSPPRGGGELRGSLNRNIHTRQLIPRQKRFRTEGGRSDEALRIGDFLILKNAKHPIQRRRKADPEIVSPQRFFGYLLSVQKVTYKNPRRAGDSMRSI